MIDELIEKEMKTYSPIGYLWVKYVMRNWQGTPDYGFDMLGLKKFLFNVQQLIRESEISDCLLSKYKYVREYRKWYENELKVK
jgi:hypothetical protein